MGPKAPQVEETSAGRFLHKPASHLSDKASDILSDTSPANARWRGWLGAAPLVPHLYMPRRFWKGAVAHQFKSDAENHSAVK